MNEKKQEEKMLSEHIASKIMRSLAIIGLVAVLLLIFWAIVQGIRFIPNAGKNIEATVSSVTKIFKRTKPESLSFNIENRSFTTGKTNKIDWLYSGETTPKEYTFSYDCGSDITFSILTDEGWIDIACDAPLIIEDDNVSVIVTNNKVRNDKTKIHISDGNKLEDSVLISVINPDIINSTVTENNSSDKTELVKTPTDTKVTIPKKDIANVSVKTDNKTAKKLKDADLEVKIEETGILLDVEGQNKFFPVSPVPSDKIGAVVFTVSNNRGIASGPWVFKAKLPTNGDDYVYTSEVQDSLTPGMEVEYTLGFDKITDKNKGKITVEIYPSKTSDKKTNNKDIAVIEIK